jgi:hypothetical protein
LLIARIFTDAVDGFYQVVGRRKILDAIGCSIGEFRRMVGVSFVITSGNTAAAAFDVKDYPAIKRRPSRDARRAKANPGVWDWKLRNKDYAAPITNRITI